LLAERLEHKADYVPSHRPAEGLHLVGSIVAYGTELIDGSRQVYAPLSPIALSLSSFYATCAAVDWADMISFDRTSRTAIPTNCAVSRRDCTLKDYDRPQNHVSLLFQLKSA